MKTSRLVLILLAGCGGPLSLAEMEPVGTHTDTTVLSASDAGVEVDAGVAVTSAPDAGEPDAGVTPVPDAGQPLTGLPCDVKTVLAAKCSACHGGHTYIMGLTSREVFLEKLANGRSIGQEMNVRIFSTLEDQMPPTGYTARLTDPERATLSQWVQAGMPGGSCGSL